MDNFGISQNIEYRAVTISLNTAYNWSATGYLQGVTCNMPATYAHELGHVVGMGHTMSPGNVMSGDNTLNDTSGFGDKRAERCIYEYDLNPAVNCG